MRRQFFLQVASMLCWVAAVIPASAQHFRLISGSYVQVAAGQSEVWALDAKNQIYRFNATSKTFVKLPGTLTLSKIAVGGGSAMQADQIWGVSPSGSIYRFNAKNNAFGRVTGTMAQIAVGEGDFDSCHPYEIWALDSSQLTYRYDFCTSKFVSVAGSLAQISTRAGSTWGVDSAGEVYHYNLFDAAWEQIAGGSVQQIVAGPDYNVRGLDASGRVYTYADGIIDATALLGVEQVGVGAYGTWFAAANGGVYHIEGPGGGTFILAPMGPIQAAQIVVGCGTGVWMISTAHHIYTLVRP